MHYNGNAAKVRQNLHLFLGCAMLFLLCVGWGGRWVGVWSRPVYVGLGSGLTPTFLVLMAEIRLLNSGQLNSWSEE